MFNANFYALRGRQLTTHWQQPVLNHSAMPLHLREAMRIKGSLTRYIQRHSGQQMRVQIIYQGWQRPLFYEQRALQLPVRRKAWVREVILSVGRQQWVYARSVIPRHALSGQWTVLRHLQQRPLGTVLFQRQRSQRGVIKTGQAMLPLKKAADRQFFADSAHQRDTERLLWARYSAFSKQYQLNPSRRSKIMLVSEYFLDDFMQQANSKNTEHDDA